MAPKLKPAPAAKPAAPKTAAAKPTAKPAASPAAPKAPAPKAAPAAAKASPAKPAAAKASKPAASKPAGGAAKPKPVASKDKAPPAEPAEKGSAAEEREFLEVWGEEAPADPWRELKSPYGGALTAAECYERLRKGVSGEDTENKFGLQEILVVSNEELQRSTSQLDPEPKSAALAVSRALEAVLENKAAGGELRLAVSGCGLESVQLCKSIAERFVELDLSYLPLASRVPFAPLLHAELEAGIPDLRSIILAGNLLTSVPRFTAEMPKLVKLDISFNDLGKLPDEDVMQRLASLRSIGLQNCMLTSMMNSKGKFALAPLANLGALDLSFNLLPDPSELQHITCLQRLQELDVGCNEMCASEAYDEALASLRRKMSTLKRVNDEAVRRDFGGYGAHAAAAQISAIADALSNDNSSCSCVEGNPCLSADNCSNWAQRFAVAHKARMEKYWQHVRRPFKHRMPCGIWGCLKKCSHVLAILGAPTSVPRWLTSVAQGRNFCDF